jgi:hypothetical protein
VQRPAGFPTARLTKALKARAQRFLPFIAEEQPWNEFEDKPLGSCESWYVRLMDLTDSTEVASITVHRMPLVVGGITRSRDVPPFPRT